MIDQITGTLIHKSLSGVVVEVGGIGLSAAVPLGTFEKLPALGEKTTLITYLNVREDALDLYGFNNREERDLFITLLKVNGVGPKMALAILSRFGPTELAQVVTDGDVRRLTTVSGIGKKTAERLLVDLKGRLKTPSGIEIGGVPGEISITAEAIRALEVLGYTTNKADEAVRMAKQKLGDDAVVEELVKLALKG